MTMRTIQLLVVIQLFTRVDAFSVENRRSFFDSTLSKCTAACVGSTCLVSKADIALAQPKEFKNIGTQAPVATFGDVEFISLNNGVKYKDFTVGTGSDSVTESTSQVQVQCSGRLLNLNGVIFYNTKNNNPDGFGAIPLIINRGQAVPGLEAGIVGMRKNGVRRIIVPAELAYSGAYGDLQPQPMSDLDRRALDSVVKNPRRDATILFDVKLERFK